METKYRAWGHLPDGEYKMFYGISLIYWNGAMMPQYEDEQICDHSLMQFTGLKDRGGKDIYESDVIECKLSFEGGALPTMGHVKYCDYYAAFGLQNDAGLTLFHNHIMSTLEIVGNLHENPELMEV